MKKIILTLFVALAAIVSVSAANSQKHSTQSFPYALFLSESKGTIDYNIPNFISGDIEVKQFEKIYRLLPSDIRSKAHLAFCDVVKKSETLSQFTYAGVKIKHYDTTWEFHYKGASIIVRNVTDKELFDLFGERDY